VATTKPKKELFDIMNSVDILLDINNRFLLLVKRKNEPFKDDWALPGGKQEPYEALPDAVMRILKQRLGMAVAMKTEGLVPTLSFTDLKKEARLHQIRTYDSGTDLRGGNTTLFAVQIHIDKELLFKSLKVGFNVSDFKIVEKDRIPKLAFDHAGFIEQYYSQLKPYPKSEKDYDVLEYERPSVTVDIIIFTIREGALKVLLIKRKAWPFKDSWALPGGFVEIDESTDEAAERELHEESGIKDVYLEQLYTFGEPKRDPRARVISVAYYALAASDKIKLVASSDASAANWFNIVELPKLAFDHDRIIGYALERIRGKIEYTTIAFQLLPEKFTMTELQEVYEIILEKKLDKRNFRKKMHELNILKELHEQRMQGAHRPAQLYAFKSRPI
jgi:8-oxo-dGTP diphosphatase